MGIADELKIFLPSEAPYMLPVGTNEQAVLDQIFPSGNDQGFNALVVVGQVQCGTATCDNTGVITIEKKEDIEDIVAALAFIDKVGTWQKSNPTHSLFPATQVWKDELAEQLPLSPALMAGLGIPAGPAGSPPPTLQFLLQTVLFIDYASVIQMQKNMLSWISTGHISGTGADGKPVTISFSDQDKAMLRYLSDAISTKLSKKLLVIDAATKTELTGDLALLAGGALEISLGGPEKGFVLNLTSLTAEQVKFLAAALVSKFGAANPTAPKASDALVASFQFWANSLSKQAAQAGGGAVSKPPTSPAPQASVPPRSAPKTPEPKGWWNSGLDWAYAKWQRVFGSSWAASAARVPATCATPQKPAQAARPAPQIPPAVSRPPAAVPSQPAATSSAPAASASPPPANPAGAVIPAASGKDAL